MMRKLLAVTVFALFAACHGGHDPRFPADLAHELAAFKPAVSMPFGGIQYPVYESSFPAKPDAPVVVILHEGPGMLAEDFRVGRMIAENGYKVYMPLMFGTPGERSNRNLWRACTSAGFHCFRNKPPEVLNWLRPFLREKSKGRRAAVIGMCLTGSVPFAVLDVPEVRVAIMSQPALPMTSGKALGVTDEQVTAGHAAIRQRGAEVVYLRFWGDKISPAARLDAFKTRVPEIEEVQVVPPRGDAHSVLALEYVDDPADPVQQAFRRVISALDGRLKPPAQ